MLLNKIKRYSFSWHLLLAWVAAFALLAFSVSAITHPLLAWTGPKSSAFMPPKAIIKADQVALIEPVLQRHNIQQALVTKLLPSDNKIVLQVTEHNDQPRRYFDLNTQQELNNYDQQHAVWLARYYALGGNTSIAVKELRFQTEFDNAYPWVNRLLPVYKVTFDTPDNLSTYVYTEINALAGLSNTYKTRVQSLFRALHTWSWLDNIDAARILLIGLLLLCIMLMTITGMAMIFLLKSKRKMTRKARAHRLLAYVLWLPLLGFSISGFWHLLHYGFGDTQRGMQLGSPINLSQLSNKQALQSLPNKPLNQISVIEHDNTLFYRLSIPANRGKQTSQGEHDHSSNHNQDKPANPNRQQRFDGIPTEQGGHYYAVQSGKRVPLTDQDVAITIGAKHLNLPKNKVSKTQLIERFGLHYDFRNKRLPVWQIDFDSELGDKVFIDPATGMLVDRLVDHDRYEGYSFSFLHKWNFLTPFTGRQWRDVIVVIFLLGSILLVILGILMRLRLKR